MINEYYYSQMYTCKIVANQIENEPETAQKLAVLSASGSYLPTGLTFGRVAHAKQAVTIGQIKQNLLPIWCPWSAIADEVTQCLQIATNPGKSLTSKRRDQLPRIVAIKGNLYFLLLTITVSFVCRMQAIRRVRQLPAICIDPAFYVLAQSC